MNLVARRRAMGRHCAHRPSRFSLISINVTTRENPIRRQKPSLASSARGGFGGHLRQCLVSASSTVRERDVAMFLVTCMTTKEIARDLALDRIAVNDITVRQHRPKQF